MENLRIDFQSNLNLALQTVSASKLNPLVKLVSLAAILRSFMVLF